MKAVIVTLFAFFFFSCNNSKTEPAKADSLTVKTNAADTAKLIIVDTDREEYCYIARIEKAHDSTFLVADYVDYFHGPNVVEEAKKRHRADTVFYKNGKIQDIFVPDDYFIVNDDDQLRRLYLTAGCPIKMDSEIAGPKAKGIDSYDYFSGHYKNSLFMLRVKNNKVEAVNEIFLP